MRLRQNELPSQNMLRKVITPSIETFEMIPFPPIRFLHVFEKPLEGCFSKEPPEIKPPHHIVKVIGFVQSIAPHFYHRPSGKAS
jgi:hypothetical protein